MHRRGHQIFIEFPGLDFGGRLLAGAPGRQMPFLPLLRIDEALRNAGLGLSVNVKKRNVAKMGNGAEPRFIDGAFGAYPLQTQYSALLGSLTSTPTVGV